MSGSYVDTAKVDLKYLNDVNDAEVGSNIASAVQARFAGVLGKLLQVTRDEALGLSDLAIGTLYGGVYQYVQFKAGSTVANARGQVVFYSSDADRGNYIVTPDPTTVLTGFAGITLNVVSKGNYGWIQYVGVATCLCKATVTDVTLNDPAFVVSDSSIGKVDANTVASITAAQLAVRIGTFWEAPANGGLKKVLLSGHYGNF